ncbi:GTP-binding protein [Metallumcola ferriviriculae]|uniref:GTP-binding protein n=1 Tax=Metallumcola ferriviriculae TaxID=3039180 RepID=A0AAU0UPX2_9FIRM|nr:GTP-binding protein [Desulfitibacteraceae bacterium MK1]
MRVQVVCGFLGAGKTTLIQNILTKAEDNVAVLVNDMGELGLDGSFLASTSSVDIVQLPGGCICCSLRSNLAEAIKDIKDKFNPEKLYIEPSGIAVGILGVLDELGPLVAVEAVVGVIDAAVYLEDAHMFGPFYKDQIKNSDILLINKIDLISEKLLKRVEDEIGRLNPAAVLFRTKHCKVSLPPGDHHQPTAKFDFHSSLETVVIRPGTVISTQSIEYLGQSLASGEFGQIIRAKGLVHTHRGWFRFDFTKTRYSIVEFPRSDFSRVVFIGTGIKQSMLAKVLCEG